MGLLAASPAQGVRARRILVVDDEVNLRQMLSAGLRKLPNVEVLTADSGESALRFLERQAVDQLNSRTPPIDLLVTDFKMRGMDGLTLTTHVNELYPGLPILVLTAYAAEARGLFALAGIHAVLDKPATIETIRAAALEALAGVDTLSLVLGATYPK